MGINKRFAEAREKMAKEALSKTGFWEEIMPHINQGVVIPILSDSFRIDQIFGEGGEEAEDESGLTISDQLVAEWATLIGYPMHDKENLARVAQYYFVEQKDFLSARTKYLEFLKTFLLTITGEDPDYADLANVLKTQVQEQSFSEIAHQLDYPRFAPDVEDPMRLLARLPLPIYITTSQSDFLERALEAEGKQPRTQVCFWSGEMASAKYDHKPDPDFIPGITTPLVYHLFGLEDYPQTLVLSEDDYVNFLISVMQDTNTLNPVIPLNLRRALGESHIILLGYRLSDWDFRVLFRLVQQYRKDEFSPRGMVIQLKKHEKRIDDVDKSLEYLGMYFDRRKFDIEWNDAEAFINKLWENWNQYRQGLL